MIVRDWRSSIGDLGEMCQNDPIYEGRIAELEDAFSDAFDALDGDAMNLDLPRLQELAALREDLAKAESSRVD